VAFFLKQTTEFYEGKFHDLPAEVALDATAFQRTTNLIEKWDILSTALCGTSLRTESALWKQFEDMISIRNELVHFKVTDYEQVIPPPRTSHVLIRLLPPSVEIRDVPHAWPTRILTPSFANWCVSVCESMITRFKEKYNAARTPKSKCR